MSQENVEIVRRFYEGWNRGDLSAALQDFHADGEVDSSQSRGPEQGVYRGVEAAGRFAQQWLDLFDEVRIEPKEFIDTDEYVVVPNVVTARGRDAIEVAARNTQVFTLRDGTIVRMRLYQERAEALAAVGLRE
jgi:ketosteroid isomerase-like protein